VPRRRITALCKATCNTKHICFTEDNAYTKYVSVKTHLYLDNRLYMSKRGTYLDLYIGHFQAHTIYSVR